MSSKRKSVSTVTLSPFLTCSPDLRTHPSGSLVLCRCRLWGLTLHRFQWSLVPVVPAVYNHSAMRVSHLPTDTEQSHMLRSYHSLQTFFRTGFSAMPLSQPFLCYSFLCLSSPPVKFKGRHALAQPEDPDSSHWLQALCQKALLTKTLKQIVLISVLSSIEI